eukprot:TRINITY_DN1735_c0_g2_i2.p1 TRINITY_DN1735_c0_g2~~TRINITY_DN1735_c0_g2_i2.p1  ORF type:complete len:490 (-),score=66.41 TRINITY_DN1735_c0_g2_i2:7-1428(-)
MAAARKWVRCATGGTASGASRLSSSSRPTPSPAAAAAGHSKGSPLPSLSSPVGGRPNGTLTSMDTSPLDYKTHYNEQPPKGTKTKLPTSQSPTTATTAATTTSPFLAESRPSGYDRDMHDRTLSYPPPSSLKHNDTAHDARGMTYDPHNHNSSLHSGILQHGTGNTSGHSTTSHAHHHHTHAFHTHHTHHGHTSSSAHPDSHAAIKGEPDGMVLGDSSRQGSIGTTLPAGFKTSADLIHSMRGEMVSLRQFYSYMKNEQSQMQDQLHKVSEHIPHRPSSVPFAITDASGLFVLLHNSDATAFLITFASDAFCALYGYSLSELVGRNWRMLQPGEDLILQSHFEKHSSVPARASQIFTNQETHKTKNGTLKVTTKHQMLYNAEGAPSFAIVTIEDYDTALTTASQGKPPSPLLPTLPLVQSGSSTPIPAHTSSSLPYSLHTLHHHLHQPHHHSHPPPPSSSTCSSSSSTLPYDK